MSRSGFVVAALVLAVAGRAARAEDVVAYEVEGDADAAGSEPRVAALDEAFAHATQTVLPELVAGDVRAAHKAVLDREIVGHARLWVARYTVTRDVNGDGRRLIDATVRIDRDKIRSRLGELDIPLIGQPTAPPTTPGPPTAGGGRPRSVTILLRVSQPDGVIADFGPNADKDTAGVAALSTAMKGAGLAVKRAPTSGAAARGTGKLPIEDDDAQALATEAKVDLALVVGVTIGAPVAIHGDARPATLVTAHVRMVARGAHGDEREGSAVTAALGDDRGALATAVEHAVLAAAADVVPQAPAALEQAGAFHGDDTPVAEPGVVLVRLAAATPYKLVAAEAKYLAGMRGVTAANIRRLSPAGWVIGVATEDSVDRVSQNARKPPTGAASASVKVTGDIVEVSLR